MILVKVGPPSQITSLLVKSMKIPSQITARTWLLETWLLEYDNNDSRTTLPFLYPSGQWCSYYYANEMQEILKPILREAFDTCPVKSPVKSARSPVKSPRSPVKSPRSPVKSPLDPTALNIVWHVRSGDVCPHCDDPIYYHTIYQFIARSLSLDNLTGERGILTVERKNLTGERGNRTSSLSNSQSNFDWLLPHQNIIVHQRYFSPHIPRLFSSLPHIILFASEDMNKVVETMLYADILVLKKIK